MFSKAWAVIKVRPTILNELISMNIYEDTNPRELKELLRQIHNGETVLPDFQRDFVWDPNMTMELIISIAENYPAGHASI